MRILVTGARNWRHWQVIHEALTEYWQSDSTAVLVSGACPTGADDYAEQIWMSFGGKVERHPAVWSIGKAAGPIRNQYMVDLGADVCLAFPHPDSRGTKHCMAAAERAGIPVRVFTP